MAPTYAVPGLFFDTSELAKIVLPKVLQFWQSKSLLLGLAINADFPVLVTRSKKQGYVGSNFALNQNNFFVSKSRDRRKSSPLEFFRHYATFRLFSDFFSNLNSFPRFSAKSKCFASMNGHLFFFGTMRRIDPVQLISFLDSVKGLFPAFFSLDHNVSGPFK